MLKERPQFIGTPEEFSNPQCQFAGRTFGVVLLLGVIVAFSAVITVSVCWLLVVRLTVNESLLGLVEAVLATACVALIFSRVDEIDSCVVVVVEPRWALVDNRFAVVETDRKDVTDSVAFKLGDEVIRVVGCVTVEPGIVIFEIRSVITERN